MIALRGVREALDAYTNSPDGLGNTDSMPEDFVEEVSALQRLAGEVRMFLDANPNIDQAIALHKRVTRCGHSRIANRPFDLPDGYLLVVEDPNGPHPFTCGIAPDGAVSS